MSFAASGVASTARTGDPIAKLCLLGLAEFTDENHVAELDIDWLAAWASISVTQAAKAIEYLEVRGFIRVLDVPQQCVQILGCDEPPTTPRVVYGGGG